MRGGKDEEGFYHDGKVVVPPRVAREPFVVVGVRDIVTILPGAEHCTVPFWRGQLVEACPEMRGRGMESGRGE